MLILKLAASLLLILGTGLIFLALVALDRLMPPEDNGRVSTGWRMRHGR